MRVFLSNATKYNVHKWFNRALYNHNYSTTSILKREYILNHLHMVGIVYVIFGKYNFSISKTQL